MKKKCLLILASFGASLLLVAPVMPAGAQEDVFDDICRDPAAADSAVCDTGGDDPLTGPDGIIAQITNIIAMIAGILAVIIIIWGGFTYITSGGDTGKLTSARNTIIYAAVGLLVIVLAQTLITFILSNII